jgi:uncharacterized membrane protein YdbT with pleckstrin-like domain
MIGIAVLRWWRVTFWWEDDRFHLCSGVFLNTHTIIPKERIVTVSWTEVFYMRPFRAVRLRMDTLGGSEKDADFTMLLSPGVAKSLFAAFKAKTPAEIAYEPRTLSVAALSLLSSNSFAGVVFIATFISQSGKLLGDEFSRTIIGTFEEVARTWALGIPPAAAAIAYLLIGGWAISFALTFLRYKNENVRKKEESLEIEGGILSRRRYSVRLGDILYLDIRQSLSTRLLGLYTLYIAAVGYAKQKEDIACLIPPEKKSRFLKSRETLFPGDIPFDRQLAPGKRGLFRFLADPLKLVLGIPAVTALVLWRLESWGPFVIFTGAMAMLPSLFFLTIRVTDYLTGGLARQGGRYTLRYSRGLYLHTVVVEWDKIVELKLSQSFFQRRSGSCDVLVYTRSESRACHRLRSLDMESAAAIFAQ